MSEGTELHRLPIPEGAEDLPAASSATISSDLAKQPGVTPPTDVEKAHFGTTVTYTIQLQGDPDTTDADNANVDVGPPEGEPTTYSVVKETFNGDSTADGDRLAQSTETVTIGSDGSGTFTTTAADSDPDNTGNIITVQYTVTAGNADLAAVPSPGTVVFSDEASEVTYVTVEVGGAQVAPGTSGTAGYAATVTVLDQFGNPFKSAGVILKSNNPTGEDDTTGSTIRTTPLLTGNSGTVRIGYSYSGDAAEETLVAMWDGYLPAIDSNDDGDTDDDGERAQVGTLGTAEVDPITGEYDCTDEDVCGHTSVYWVMPATAQNQGAVTVLSGDADNDQAIVDVQTDSNVTPTSVNYDSNDFFTIISVVDGSDVSTPSTLDDFEAALSKALEDEVVTELSWTSYVYDDSADITSFILDVTGGN